MTCPHCGTTVPANLKDCQACGKFVGFPNVRLASRPEERTALAHRYEDARTSATARNCEGILEDFGRAVSQSSVVIARGLEVIHSLVKAENTLYVNYYRQVQSGARLPEENQWDKGREAADSTVSPHFYRDLSWGALSLSQRGPKAFGQFSIVLRENMIEHRTTVFEENPFKFCIKHRIVAGQGAPLGYRATWSDRAFLAMAKLHTKISSTTTFDQFPRILLDHLSPKPDVDLIEAHIYGEIHRSAIERVVGPAPRAGHQKVLWKSVQKALNEVGATIEVA